MKLVLTILVLLTVTDFLAASADEAELKTASEHPEKMVLVDEGWYTPLYKQDGNASRIHVQPFLLDQFPVTNQEFLTFTESQPAWKAENVNSIFADQGYLNHIDASRAVAQENQPVTNVSWYAAMAYCKAMIKTLPSVDQWEYAAQANDVSPTATEHAEFRRKILDWYAKPATAPLPDVQDTEMNFWGVHGMHGVVWEQVSDFNSVLVTGESRGDSTLDKRLFCGSGAAQAVDPGDYAAFMRYALRSSYAARYTLSTMGFRCAKNL